MEGLRPPISSGRLRLARRRSSACNRALEAAICEQLEEASCWERLWFSKTKRVAREIAELGETAKRDLIVVGCAASIGFTVALFVCGVAFPLGAIQDAAKMGALLSMGGALVTIALARALGVRRRDGAWSVAPAGY
jgi:hypothetical protein